MVNRSSRSPNADCLPYFDTSSVSRERLTIVERGLAIVERGCLDMPPAIQGLKRTVDFEKGIAGSHLLTSLQRADGPADEITDLK